MVNLGFRVDEGSKFIIIIKITVRIFCVEALAIT